MTMDAKDTAAPVRVLGRPTVYTQDKADEICVRLAAGESLNAICKDDRLPPESTVRGWVLDNLNGFSANYARAREIGYESHADKIIELSDECRVGLKRTTKGNGEVETVEGDMVERSRLQIEARKWILAKMLPKKYGDKLDLNHGGSVRVFADSQDEAL